MLEILHTGSHTMKPPNLFQALFSSIGHVVFFTFGLTYDNCKSYWTFFSKLCGCHKSDQPYEPVVLHSDEGPVSSDNATTPMTTSWQSASFKKFQAKTSSPYQSYRPYNSDPNLD